VNALRKIRGLLYLARDAGVVALGKDYFHQPQPLGSHFLNPACYYNDFRGKALWHGPLRDGLPALYVPAWGEDVLFPIMVLQFGLGCFDRWALGEGEHFGSSSVRVVRWIRGALNEHSHLDNLFPRLRPAYQYHSSNSGMAQGEAMSLMIRVVRSGLLCESEVEETSKSVESIFRNMVLPVESGGTLLRNGKRAYFCEACRRDGHWVMNGWIYAVFGLLDYCIWSGNRLGYTLLEEMLASLRAEIPGFLLPDGWSRYDNAGRIASPFYQRLHANLFEALGLLFGDDLFAETSLRLRRGETNLKIAKYTLRKVFDRVRESESHSTSKR
jgi:heparosan-N-sulfate-glucuronate 5-epimerase